MVHIPNLGKLLLPTPFYSDEAANQRELSPRADQWLVQWYGGPMNQAGTTFSETKIKKGQGGWGGQQGERLPLFLSTQAVNCHLTYHTKSACWKMKADNEESRVRSRDRKKADSPNWASGSHHNWSYIHPRLLSGASVNFVHLVKHVELSFRHLPPKASWPVHWMHISFTFTKWSRDRRRMAQGKPSQPWNPSSTPAHTLRHLRYSLRRCFDVVLFHGMLCLQYVNSLLNGYLLHFYLVLGEKIISKNLGIYYF